MLRINKLNEIRSEYNILHLLNNEYDNNPSEPTLSPTTFDVYDSFGTRSSSSVDGTSIWIGIIVSVAFIIILISMIICYRRSRTPEAYILYGDPTSFPQAEAVRKNVEIINYADEVYVEIETNASSESVQSEDGVVESDSVDDSFDPTQTTQIDSTEVEDQSNSAVIV